MEERKNDSGCTILIVGLSAAGKSTLARLIEEQLLALGYPAILLEPSSGKEVRDRLLRGLGFERDDKNQTTLRLGYVARLITQAGGIAIVPWIAPEKWARDQIRNEIGRFVEVYVRCPLDVCEGRDDRGLYGTAAGSRSGLSGVDDPWDPPEDAEVVVDSAEQSPEEEAAVVMERLADLGYVNLDVRLG